VPTAGDKPRVLRREKKRGNPSAPRRARQSSQSKVLVLISQIRTLATRRAGKRKSKSKKDSAREGPAAGWDPGVLQAGGRKKDNTEIHDLYTQMRRSTALRMFLSYVTVQSRKE
jgi:hypothetical protein